MTYKKYSMITKIVENKRIDKGETYAENEKITAFVLAIALRGDAADTWGECKSRGHEAQTYGRLIYT